MNGPIASFGSDELLLDSGSRLWLDIATGFPGLAHLAVAGCHGGEGATTIAKALAIAAAKDGKTRVLLVDAAKSGEGLSNQFGQQGAVISHKADMPAGPKGIRSLSRGLDFLPHLWAQPDGPSAAELYELRQWAGNHYDLVIWDCPGILGSIASLRVVAQTQNAVLVTQTDKTTQNELRSALEEIGLQGGKAVAILRNRAGRKLFGFGAD